jgi:uncharacterized protein YecT (DUF1311 family)
MLAAQADPPLDCREPLTQLAMNICSYQDFQAADRALNAQWAVSERQARAIDRENPPPTPAEGRFRQLLTAQRAWIAFRDAHCLALADQYRGGSIRPLMQNTCMTALTQSRTAQLREFSETN